MAKSFNSNRRQVSHKRAQKTSNRRRVLIEKLEDRRLLAAGWHNPVMPGDVNADQRVSALDALAIINEINLVGIEKLPELAPGAQPRAYYDTNGDGNLSALDALFVINAINVRDSTGSGTPAIDQPKVNIVPVNATTILATYDRPMSASAINPANYRVTGDDGQSIEVLAATFGEGESMVQLQTAPQSSSGYTVNIQNVTDGAGQNVFFEGRKLLTGNPKGAVVSVAAVSPTKVVVVFNEAMADNALAPQNYSIKDSSGKPLQVTDVRFNGPLGMVFVLTTAAQSDVNYQLTVSKVTDLQNDDLQSNSGSFRGIAGLPKLLAATPAGPNSVLVTFNQAMSDDALSPSAYVIKNSAGITLSVLNAEFIGTERRLIQLTTGPQSPGTYTVQSITATDTSGNPVSPTGAAGIFQGAPAPSLINAIPTDTTHVVLTFGGPVGDSALTPSSYKLEKLDSQGNVATTLPISSTEIIGSQRTVVSLTVPYQSDAQYRITTTSSLSDPSGSPLPIVSREFQGLGTQPKVISTTSTGPTAVLVTFTVSMSDDALTPASYAISNASGVSLPVTNVQFVGTDRRVVQLTTGRQAAGTYSIVSLTATDLGGSQVAAPGAAGEFAGAPAPTLSKASPADPTHIVLTFTGPVSDSALAPSSYLLEKLDAQGNVVGSVSVSSAEFIGSQHTVVSITTPYLAEGRFRIATTSALSDTSGSPLDTVQLEFQGVGVQPKLLGVTSSGPSTVLVITSAAMSDDVLAPSSYVIRTSSGAVLEVLSAQFVGTERRVIQLTTAPQLATAYTVLSISANDLSGNPLASPGGTGVFQGAAETKLVRSIPTDPTHIFLTFGGPVGDSALSPSSYAIDKLDAQGNVVGSLSVNSADFIGDQRTVVSLTTPYQADSRYRISTTSALANAAGATLANVQQEFQGFSSLAKLVAVASTGPTTVQTIFNVPMSDDALSPTSYSIHASGVTLPVLSVKFVGTEKRIVELTTAPQVPGPYTIQSITATDINGSPVIAIGSTGSFVGSLATTASHATPTDATHIVLTFGGPVGDSALAPSSYKIDKLDAQGNVVGSLAIASAVFIGDQHRVISLTTPFQTSGKYRISTTTALRDVSGASLPVVQLPFQGLGIPAKLVGATSTGQQTMLLTFSVSMSDDALSPSSYVIQNANGVNLPIVSAQFVGTERRVIKLTTAPQSAELYTIQSITATEVSGNSVSPTIAIGGVQGIAAPSLNIATAADSTHIYLTFAGPVGDSALSPSSYQIQQLDAQGNVIGNLAVSSSAFVGDQRTVVAITTPGQTDGQYRIATTSTLTDVSGSPVPVVQLVFRGVGSQAKLVGATSTGSTTMLLTFNVSMSDDVLSPSSYVINNSGGVNLPVVSAQFVGTERRVVQLTTGPQSNATYTIQSITATDVSGNSVSSNVSIGGIQGSATPSLNIATATDSTHIYLTFAGPVGDSALAPSSYQIQKLDASGNVIGNLAVTSANFVGDQRTVVSLTTPSQSNGSYRLSTTNTLTNVAGSPVPTVQLTFQGIGSQAQLVAVASTSSTTLIVTFNVPMSDDALSPSLYVIQDANGSRLQVTNAQFIGTERRLVQLSTGPQISASYTVVSINATDVGGSTTIVPTTTHISTFPGPITSGGSSVPVDGAPRLTGAVSLSNTSVLVAFSEPMADNVLNVSHYFIGQQHLNAEVGYVPILAAEFYSDDHSAVVLTTGSQNEVTYSVTAINVTDQAGITLAPATDTVIVGGLRIDPSTAIFPGTPPSGSQIVDTDGDGLTDNVEVRGWTVTVALLNGDTVTREVTSDPNIADTDGDGLWDAQELNIGTDPRSADTDGDQLNDYAEFNEIYSDPWNQDTDADGLDDFLEFSFFKTSPYLADTDGDQIEDADEIFGNRNPRVSDLPRPEISIGEVNLQLDVRFSESNDQERRDLETRAVTTTLSQSNRQMFSRSDTVNIEAHMEASFELNTVTGELTLGATAGGSVGYTFEQSSESETATERAYESSLSTDKEVTRGFTVERQVEGALMQIAVDLRNVSSLAYRIKNLQVTAFIQDPQDHSRLTPVATLLPDNEPDEGYTLGPLVAEKGPIIFKNDAIIPSLVESLMANSSGLIFRISNYDIIDENDRNFAFTSQEIVERTSRLVIDYGGASSLRALLGGEKFDELQPGDETEIYRVATSAGQVIDTNFDGVVDDSDRRAVFDANGKEVGITLFEALSAVGLTRYEARGPIDPVTGALAEYELDEPIGALPVQLTEDQILSSYSTFKDSNGREKIYRIRGISNDAINQKYWEILTPLGIDQFTNVNDLVLKSNTPVSINFVQDLDGDKLSADVEFFLRTSDSPLPVGANVPVSTDFTTNESVTYSTDPGFVTGALVRVSESVGGLLAGQDYFVRKLSNVVDDGSASFSFYNSEAIAEDLVNATTPVNLTDNITAGIFSPVKPASTSTAANFVTFASDPGFATATIVHVTTSGGGLTAGNDYMIRENLDGTYSFFDSTAKATAGNIADRVNLTDNITAAIFNPMASGRDTDRDGLDDRFEALIGWTVTTPQKTYKVYSSPNRADSNFDDPKPITDSDEDGIEDRLEYNGSDYFAAPDGWNDRNQDGLRDRFEVYQQLPLTGVRDRDYVLDPLKKDTDADGISDATEITGFRITRIENGQRPLIPHTDPNNPFSDSDTFSDGFEKLVGLDPLNGNDTDVDGDGLPDVVETNGWAIGNAIPEVQKVTVSTTGTFTLKYGTGPSSEDNTTAAMPVSATARDLQQRLNILRSIRNDGGIISVSRTGNEFLVSFGGELAGLNQGTLISTGSASVTTVTNGVILLEGVSSTGFANGPLTALRGYSSTDSVDTDGDGLTDFEEFFLRTDASWKDTDNDGIDDRVEYLGYSLEHKVGERDLGIIKTNPLDADTDNDKRTDGQEAELVDIEQNAWVVRVRGETPYRVYSNPLLADADFDGLVDGDEFNLDPLYPNNHTDPNNGNTDGDLRDDGAERGVTNPLAVDTRVTIVVKSITTVPLGGDNISRFDISLAVRPPGTGVAGLNTESVPIYQTAKRVGAIGVHTFSGYAQVFYKYYNDQGVLVDSAPEIPIGYDFRNDHWWNGATPFSLQGKVPLNAHFFVAWRDFFGAVHTAKEELINSGDTSVQAAYQFSDAIGKFVFSGLALRVGVAGFTNVGVDVLPQDNLALDLRSRSFGMANDERFSIEGTIAYFDYGSNTVKQLKLGGLEGEKAFQSGDQNSLTESRSVFSWIQVADKYIEDYYFEELVNGVKLRIDFFYIVG